jgi:hypothetical protein
VIDSKSIANRNENSGTPSDPHQFQIRASSETKLAPGMQFFCRDRRRGASKERQPGIPDLTIPTATRLLNP